MSEEEEIYENINILVKKPADGSWSDIILDLISHDCRGGGGDCIVEPGDESDCDDHEHTEILPCTCGLQSMGETQGTIQQCYDSEENIGHNLKLIDLARAIVFLSNSNERCCYRGHECTCKEDNASVTNVIEWANKEIEWEDSLNEQELERG